MVLRLSNERARNRKDKASTRSKVRQNEHMPSAYRSTHIHTSPSTHIETCSNGLRDKPEKENSRVLRSLRTLTSTMLSWFIQASTMGAFDSSEET